MEEMLKLNATLELYLEDNNPDQEQTIVVLHGGPGANAYPLQEGWRDMLEDYRVIFYDQRGSGRSSPLPADNSLFTIDAMVDDLEGVRRKKSIQSMTLLTHGFGAVVAAEYSRRYPERLDGIVAVSPWFRFPWLARQIHRQAAKQNGTADADPSTPVQALLEEAFLDHDAKPLLDAMMFYSLQARMEHEWLTEGETIMGSDTPSMMFLRNGLWEFDYTEYLLELAVPMHVVVGRQDLTSFPEAETMADLTGGHLEVINQAGHYPWLEQPYDFEQALHTCLEAQDD